MPVIKIKLGSREFELACPEDSQQHIYSLAEKLDMQINKFQETNPSSSFDFAMAITALNLLEAKENISQEQLGADLDDAVKLASEKAANKAREVAIIEADKQINELRLELENTKSALEKLTMEKQNNSLESDQDNLKIHNELQNLLAKI